MPEEGNQNPLSSNRRVNISGSIYNNINTGQVANQMNNYQSLDLENNLAEVAAEIQQLFNQLSQTHPAGTTTEKMVMATEVIKKIESNPRLKSRIIQVFKTRGVNAIEQLFNHPAASFTVAALLDSLQ